MKSFTDLTLADAARALNDRAISSRELVAESIRQAKSINPRVNAFLRIDEDQALGQASIADREREQGHMRGPLQGIPLGVKDMFHRAGLRSSYGAATHMPLPATTATVLKRLDSAGAVQVGVLNMTAFAVGPTGHNTTTGHCRNPWDPERITGGSSSGSGAAVAARSVFGALGSDTAGSIRIPAGLCGITGLKPTYGRVSRAGCMGFSFTLDVIGPMARTAEDCAILMNAIAGPDAGDPTTVPVAPPDFTRDLTGSVRGLKIGVFDPAALGQVDEEILKALDEARSVFTDLGCELVPLNLLNLEAYDAAAGIVLASEGSALHAELMREQGLSYGKQMRTRLERGFAVPAPHYIDALRRRTVGLQRITADVFSLVDAVLLPVTAIKTPRIADSDVESGADIDHIVRQLTRFTRPFNFLGLPSLTVPMGFDGEGMPIAMQFVGRSLSEERLLQLGHAYQTVCEWHRQWPQLHTAVRQGA